MGRGKAEASLQLIAAAKRILEEIQPASVRAICYQLFNAKLIPSMAKSATTRVSHQLVYAREQDIIDWRWISDETREAEVIASWEDPDSFLKDALTAYRKDFWQQQPERVEIWSEKGTVRGTLAPVLQNYGLTFRVTHGTNSFTAVKTAIADVLASPQPVTVLYVGDWDPSGLHMSEQDLPERLARYGAPERFTFMRVALTLEDISDPALPSYDVTKKRPGKAKGNPCLPWYLDYMRQCSARLQKRGWELDALSPVTLRRRVETAVQQRIDMKSWERCVRAQAAEEKSLRTVLDAWRSISGPGRKYDGNEKA